MTKKATEAKTGKAAGKAKGGIPKVSTADKFWLKSYPPGVSAEIDLSQIQPLNEMLVAACREFASRSAFTCMGKTITYAELDALSARLTAHLQASGLKKADRVAVMLPNILQYPVAMLGILRAGMTIVNVNPLYTARELEHQLNDSGASAIIVLENFAATVESVIANTSVKHVIVASMGEMLGGLKGAVVNLVVRRVKKMVPPWSLPGHVGFSRALSSARGAPAPVEVTNDDIAFLQYTGGTTGVSKGAILLHSNVAANVIQNSEWVEVAFRKKVQPDQLIYICALPLYHIFALTVNALVGMRLGAQNVLIPNPRDIPAFVKEMQKYRFNVLPGLNTLFNALLHNRDFAKLDFSQLMLTLGGGMAVQRAVAERWKELTSCVISEGYGLSETSPVATANRFDAEEFSGTIGLPIPSTDISIRDDAGKPVKTGEIGEICIRGPQVMAGYWNRPDETAKVMTDDGYFRSGDMGVMDENGYTRIVDRKKDMILVSGFNVYPNEIEDVVASHPGVLEVAAIGVPDEKSGEVPKIYVVRKDENLTEADLVKFCRKNLTGYKIPRHIEFRDDLPKSNVGKILRRELRE